jgi:hypothetical protein
MKKIGVLIFILLLFSFSFVAAVEDGGEEMPDSGTGIDRGDVDTANELIGKIPLDPETGGVNKSQVAGYKSKAEERLAAINAWLEWTDPVFDFVFGIKLRMSWEFTYLFFLILASLSLFHNLPIWIGFKQEWFAILVAFGVTAGLGFFRVLKWIVDWIIKVTNTWWWSLIVIGLFILLIVVIGFGSKIFAAMKLKRAKKDLIESAEEAEESAEHIEKVAGAIDKGLTPKYKDTNDWIKKNPKGFTDAITRWKKRQK